MALVAVFMEILFAAILSACMRAKVVKQPDEVIGYMECCDPGISEAQKDMCKWLDEKKANALRAADGRTIVGVWSDCEPGKERWREWEK